MSSPTAQQVALNHLLPYIGVTSLAPQPSGSELENIQPMDLANCAMAMNSAFQEMWKMMPTEAREFPEHGVLRPPTNVTLTATQFSVTVSALTTWASWMIGCTVRIQGDDQDNEVINATTLARPYMGASGSGITATVYCDAIALDASIGSVISPVNLPNQMGLFACSTREEFNQVAGMPLVTNTDGTAYGTPWFSFFRRTVQRPRAWFVEGFYDSTQSFQSRRLRFAPMPDQAYSVSYRAAKNPIRIVAADIDPGAATYDVIVSLAGSSAVNGTYNRILGDDIEGAPHYQLSTDHTIQIYTDAAGIWYIDAPGVALYASTDAPYYPWLVSQWTVDVLGSSRLPTVTMSTTDPGKVLPISDEMVELLFLPIALKWFSGTPSFKNDSLRPLIEDRYKLALVELRGVHGQISLRNGAYLT